MINIKRINGDVSSIIIEEKRYIVRVKLIAVIWRRKNGSCEVLEKEEGVNKIKKKIPVKYKREKHMLKTVK